MSINNYVLTPDGNFISDEELYHHGIKGMKWGIRRYQNADGSLTPAGKKRLGYKSISVQAALAKRSNDKVDKGFENWKNNVKKRDDAIELGKKANAARRSYEANPKNKEYKSAYRQANKDYKKALASNTTYRKGVIRKEVSADASRKYLSDAKKVQKQLAIDPSNKVLQKEYNELMSKHDIERARARRAVEVSSNRSKKKAAIKRTMTMTVKTAATTTAVAVGAYAANRYLANHDVMINGKMVRLNAQAVKNVVGMAKKARKLAGFVNF